MRWTALGMYAAALVDGLVEGLLPGDPPFAIVPVVIVGGIVAALLLVGPRLPRRALGALGPLGVALVGAAVATTPGTGDGAVLYALPVLWMSFFFGRAGAVAIVACVGAAHALALRSLPTASAFPGRWVDVMVSVCAVAAVVVALDERSRASRERAREEARIAAAARDAAVEASNATSMFVAKVSHELRTPLNGVLGTTELLRDTRLDEEQREYVDIAASAAEGLLLVINDILDYAKLDAGRVDLELAPFSPRELVGEACAMLLVIARSKGIELTSAIDAAVPAWLRGDAARIRQVLVNLLSNAVKFTEAGAVTVLVSARDAREGATTLRVAVRDSGIGIDAPALERLFQPFTQADNSTTRRYGGTGLGLTISAQLVESMGGRIGAASTPGAGSTFWFEIELDGADDAAAAAPDVDVAAATPEVAGALVLVAEDNPINQILAVRILENLGCEADLVGDGRAALAAVAQRDYDVVLMDCEMPAMDGFRATREIRRCEGPGRRIPIVAMTAHSMPGDRERCLAAGMDDYVSKPIRSAQLAEILGRHRVGRMRTHR